MHINSYISEISKSIEQAKYVHLSKVVYNEWNRVTQKSDGPERSKFLEDCEIDVYSFPQTWGSTALGFGGLGGSAMTNAVTVVITSHMSSEAVVYFGGRFAYKIEKYNSKFIQDISNHRMASRQDHNAYEAE
jgi:hypothetical protein